MATINSANHGSSGQQSGDSPSQDETRLLREKLNRFLEHKLLKNTKSRRIVMDHFLSLKKGHHESAESVYKNLNDQGHKMSLATIYRSINLLVEADILVQHSFHQSSWVYEINYPNMHHDHLVCLDCGEVKEFEDEQIEQRQILVANKLGFKLIFHKLELFGTCTTENCPHLK